MSKVTSKRQVTIPKRIADQYGIEAGDEIAWLAEGGAIRVVVRPSELSDGAPSTEERLELYDQATERQRRRDEGVCVQSVDDRGWTREELYDRDLPR